MQLRPYQRMAITSIMGEFDKGVQRTLLVLPTGCGKTIVMNGIAFHFSRVRHERVLILAHQNILIDQCADKLSSIMQINPSREQGKRTCIGSDELVTVSSVQTISRRINKFPPDFFTLIIIDEAHHTESKQYKRLLEHFTSAKVLGVTATPDRADRKKLKAFQTIAYKYSVSQAIKDGYLSPFKVVKGKVAMSLKAVKKTAGDYRESDLASVIEPRLHEIAKEVKRLADGRRIVCFVPLIKTARKAAEVFEGYGFKAAWTAGEDKDKDQKLQDFQAGEYDIIFNSMLLTEGWDCPETDCVIILRPTLSRALYTQMVGRGLRLAEGKTDCLLIDFLFQNSRFTLACPDDVLGEDKPKAKRQAPKKAGGPVDREVSLNKNLTLAQLRKGKVDFSDCADPFERFSDVLGKRVTVTAWNQPTEKQRLLLIQKQLDPRGLTFDQAKSLISHLEASRKPSQAQKWRLKQIGYPVAQIDSMSFTQAQKALKQAKAMGRW